MTDLAAIKSRLSNPREVAAMLGLRVLTKRANGVITACPVHGNRSGSLLMRVGPDGTLQVNCKGCGFGPHGQGGDVFTLLAAIEGDFRRGLARAVEMAGGAVGAPVQAWQAPEKCDPDVYHKLATRILDAGKLDGRTWTRDVGEYLQQRGLLKLAQADGWGALPSLGWLLDIARGVCEDSRVAAALGGPSNGPTVYKMRLNGVGHETTPLHEGLRSKTSEQSGAFAFGPRDLLVKAKLAQWNQRGEFVPYFGRWTVVIPWRGPDGRICALQRRRVMDGDGPKYVLPWAPEWPYGSERVRRGTVSLEGNRAAAIVEGAVDVLALRALHPAFVALGIPGIGSWRASWASLVEGRGLRVALDRGKPGPDGIIPEDRTSARIALDCAGRGQETDRVLEWWLGRWRRGRALGCVLCGRQEPYEWSTWLCGGCGRRRAPKGSDWGGLWEARRVRGQ